MHTYKLSNNCNIDFKLVSIYITNCHYICVPIGIYIGICTYM